MTPQPLNTEELKQHQDFIYHCTLENVYLKSSAKFGRDLNLTVQEMVNSSVTTLRGIGTQIEKAAKEAGSSDFSLEGPFKIAGVAASDWINFLKLQIRLTQVAEDSASKKEKLRKLKEQLEEFKTPGEKRTEIEQAIAALENPIGAAVVAATS